MYLKVLTLIYAFLALISLSENANPYEDKFKTLIKYVCESKLTDEQCANIKTNCIIDSDVSDIITKKCVKKDTLTDRERITAGCDETVFKCLTDELNAIYNTYTDDKKKESITKLTTFEECVKSKCTKS